MFTRFVVQIRQFISLLVQDIHWRFFTVFASFSCSKCIHSRYRRYLNTRQMFLPYDLPARCIWDISSWFLCKLECNTKIDVNYLGWCTFCRRQVKSWLCFYKHDLWKVNLALTLILKLTWTLKLFVGFSLTLTLSQNGANYMSCLKKQIQFSTCNMQNTQTI